MAAESNMWRTSTDLASCGVWTTCRQTEAVLLSNFNAWTYVRERWRMRDLIGVDFFVQLLGE
jgi:hypothetical protein